MSNHKQLHRSAPHHEGVRRRHCRRRLPGLFILSVVFLCASCFSQSDGPQRYKATGNVLVDGIAAPYGEMMFRPDTSKGNSGPGAVVEIRDGQYETLPDKGLTAGPHIVDITVLDGMSTPASPHGLPMLKKRYSTEFVVPEKEFSHDFEIPASFLKAK